jgi:hypothetical protein
MADKEQQENEINPDIDKPKIAPGEEYMGISNFAPAKQVELPTEGNPNNPPPSGEANGAPRSLTDSMDDATDLTDMQFAFKNMFMGDEYSKRRQFGRIDPGAFLTLLDLGMRSVIMTSDPSKPINVHKELDRLYYDYGVGLNGDGRMDGARLLGAAREIKKEESLIKGL